MERIEVVVDGVTEEEAVVVDVRVGKLDKLIELVKDCVAENDGLAVIEMVYDPDGVPLDDFEAVADEEGLIVRVVDGEDDTVRVYVAVRERLDVREDERESVGDEVFVTVGEEETVAVYEVLPEVVGDDDNV
jgi:hypothetical protein